MRRADGRLQKGKRNSMLEVDMRRRSAKSKHTCCRTCARLGHSNFTLAHLERGSAMTDRLLLRQKNFWLTWMQAEALLAAIQPARCAAPSAADGCAVLCADRGLH